MIGMKGKIVADHFDGTDTGKTETADVSQFHIKDAVAVVGLEYKIGVRVADGLRKRGGTRQYSDGQNGFRVRHIGVVETCFRNRDKGTEVEVCTARIADIEYLGVGRHVVQSTNDIDCSDARNQHFVLREYVRATELCGNVINQFALAVLGKQDKFFHIEGKVTVFSRNKQ